MATVDVVAAVLSVWKNICQVGMVDKNSLSECIISEKKVRVGCSRLNHTGPSLMQ
jgi:hypothetical protein